MLSWSITFLVIGLIAGVLGLSGIAGAATQIAWILFVVFVILFVVTLIMGADRPSRHKAEFLVTCLRGSEVTFLQLMCERIGGSTEEENSERRPGNRLQIIGDR